MKILLVIDQYDDLNNGTTISAKRFAKGLEDLGHTVYILSSGENAKNKYTVNNIPLPIGIGKLVHSQGMDFAMPNKEIEEKAIKDVDIVHFYMPFFLSNSALKITKKLNIPHTAAFHVQPENITYSIGLGKNKMVNDMIYNVFRDVFYKNFDYIHCPSDFIAGELKEHGYNSNLCVISNGIISDFKYTKPNKPKEFKDKFIITMIGRYSNEKRQDLLIEAAYKSKYSDKIQIVLAGKGPKKNALEKQGKNLKNKPIMKFYSKEDLVTLLGNTDLYVHAADAEIEAISCIEAFACGNVPIIANSSKSATKQFALDDRSLFEAGNSTDLANKIDYFIENPKELKKMQIEYSEHAEKYRIENSIKQIERMFEDAIEKFRKSNSSK